MSDNRPKWLFEESTQVGVDYTNEQLVADYDEQHEGFRDFEQEAQKIASALGLSKDSIVLDIGCGTGGLTTHLAQTCKHVYAVDVSEAMIAVLTGKISRQGLNNVSPVQSGFLTYSHKGEAPDAIVASITLHHLPDFWKQIALCRLYDLLKPGGRMFLADVVFGFDPRTYRETIETFRRRYEGKGIEQVVAVESRGFIFGAAVAYTIGAGFVPVRKPGKLPAETLREEYELEYGTDAVEIHRDAIQPGQKVLVLDDLLATGGTLAATCRLVQELGGEIVEVVTLIELTFLSGRAKLGDLPYHTVLQFD